MRKIILMLLFIVCVCAFATAQAQTKDSKAVAKAAETLPRAKPDRVELSNEQSDALAQAQASLEQAEAQIQVIRSQVAGLLNGICLSAVGPNWRQTHRLVKTPTGYALEPLSDAEKPKVSAPQKAAPSQPAEQQAPPKLQPDNKPPQ